MSESGAGRDAGAPACLKCVYYHLTWDAHAPYGCRAHGFKSKRNPALVVYESSGFACQLFERRQNPKPDGDKERS